MGQAQHNPAKASFPRNPISPLSLYDPGGAKSRIRARRWLDIARPRSPLDGNGGGPIDRRAPFPLSTRVAFSRLLGFLSPCSDGGATAVHASVGLSTNRHDDAGRPLPEVADGRTGKSHKRI